MKSLISLSITALLVKAYMLVSFVWVASHKTTQYFKMAAEQTAAELRTNVVG